MKEIIIIRKKWGQSYLRSSMNGKLCCLGFAAEAYGVSCDATKNIQLPSALSVENQAKLPKWFLDATSALDGTDVSEAARINDDQSLTMTQKERRLKPIFAKHRIKLIFKGKP